MQERVTTLALRDGELFQRNEGISNCRYRSLRHGYRHGSREWMLLLSARGIDQQSLKTELRNQWNIGNSDGHA